MASDAFQRTGAMGSPWENLSSSSQVANFECDGDHAKAIGDWDDAGAQHGTSTADVSEAVLAPMADASLATSRYVTVRGDGTDYYTFRLYDNDGSGNYNSWEVRREGSGYIAGSAGSGVPGGPYSRTVQHTLRIAASGTTTVTLTVSVDGNQVWQGNDGYPSPLQPGGHPGIRAYGGAAGGEANTLFESWTDGEGEANFQGDGDEDPLAMVRAVGFSTL